MFALVCGIFAMATGVISAISVAIMVRTIKQLRAELYIARHHIATSCRCYDCVHERLEVMAVQACLDEKAPVLLEAFKDKKGEVLVKMKKL